MGIDLLQQHGLPEPLPPLVAAPPPKASSSPPRPVQAEEVRPEPMRRPEGPEIVKRPDGQVGSVQRGSYTFGKVFFLYFPLVFFSELI